MKKIVVTFLAICSLAFMHSASAADSMLSAGVKGIGGISFGGASVTATEGLIEYEIGLSDLFAISVNVGQLGYTATTDNPQWNILKSEEKGDGTILAVDAKFYPGREMFSGFYVGPGFGLGSGSATVTESYDPLYTLPPLVRTRSVSGTISEVHARAGWKIEAGAVVIGPSVQLGTFLSAPNGTDGLGFYMLLGINVGMKF